MEQHPVPQNVTQFQFHLIGDMTMKQFGYLAAGAITAFIFYKLPLPQFLTIPLAALAALLGFGLAFVPIEERPMDIWVFAFLKSVFSPTQYIWQRTPGEDSVVGGQKSEIKPASAQAPQAPAVKPEGGPVSKEKTQPETQKHTPKKGFFSWLLDIIAPRGKPTAPPAKTPTASIPRPQVPQPPVPKAVPEPVRAVTTPSIVGTPVEPPKETVPETKTEQNVDKKTKEAVQQKVEIDEAKVKELENKLRALEESLQDKNQQSTRITELQAQLTSVLSDRERMEAELGSLRNKVKQMGSRPEPTRNAGVVDNQSKQPTVKVISADSAVKAGLPKLTTVPNVVTGIIKDHLNNLLPGVLVTVKDREGMPVRALKTNKLGQFAASTPLPNNTYFVEVEDPKNSFIFDRIQITLTGGVVPPIEVIAKSEREINRRKLEDQIFGNHQ